jgi:mRNA interferase RelE/StbE
VSYRVLVDSRAARSLQKLPKHAVERIDKLIGRLSEDPRPPGVKMLRGRFKEGWRIRVGEYRLLYRIDDDSREVRIFEIGHRREVYR